MQPGGSDRNHTDRAIEGETWESHFTSHGAPVMIAIRPEKLLQIIIGPGDMRHRKAGKAPWPLTAGDLTDSVPGARPPFFDPLDIGSNRGEAVVEFEPRGLQEGRPSAVRALRTAAQ